MPDNEQIKSSQQPILQAAKGEDYGTYYTIRVRGGKNPTDPIGLKQSILHSLKTYDCVLLMHVGEKAEHIALAAVRMARKTAVGVAPAIELVFTQEEYSAEINGAEARGVCTKVWPIPKQFAR